MCVMCIIKLLTFFNFEIALVPEKEIATTVEYILYYIIVNKTFKYLYSCIHEQCGNLLFFFSNVFYRGQKACRRVYLWVGTPPYRLWLNVSNIYVRDIIFYIIKHFTERAKKKSPAQ